jgi:hypothetical protein
MRTRALFRIGALLCVLPLIVVAVVILRGNHKPSASLRNPDLEYLKAVNSVAPPKDPELMFILMTEFASSNSQDDGAGFFSARLKEFEPQLTPVQKSLYLGIIGLLRAQHASSVPLLKRYGYVKETIATLDQSKQLSGGQVFVVNWIAGVVRTELPGYFHQRAVAQEELAWCVEHIDKAPHPAWLREVYFHLGKLALNNGDKAKAQDYLRRSGYSDFDHPITLATPFSEDRASGQRLHRGAFPRSFLVGSTPYRVSNSRNTTSWFRRTDVSSSALTQAHARTSHKAHTKRCRPMRQDCRR